MAIKCKGGTSEYGYNSDFPERLRAIMENRNGISPLKRKVSQSELANHLGITSQAVSSYTLGTSIPDMLKFKAIADFFDVSADYLLGKTNVRTPDCDLQSVCEYTGLSEASIAMIRTLAVEDTFCLIELDNLIQNREVLLALVRYIATVPVDGYLIVNKVGGIRSEKPRDELGPMDLVKFPVSEIIESAFLKDLTQKIDTMRRKTQTVQK